LSTGKDKAELRRRAETRLAELRGRDERGGEPDATRLVHELRVHQIELEMQNEELLASRSETEALLGRYTELFDFAPIGFFHVAQDGKIARSNFAGARLLGAQQRGALVGLALADFVVQRERRAFERLLAPMLVRRDSDAPSDAGEFTMRAGGEEVVARVTVAGLSGGTLPSALLAAEDVTARRRAEEALAEEVHRKDEFLAALSHELRNPLAPIRNALYILQRFVPGGDRAVAALAIVDRQVSYLTRIVDDLLDATRVARGKIRLNRERLELGELVRQTVEDHRPAFDARALVLRCDVDPTELWVDVDASRVAQVIGNLLGNALKFTNPGDHVQVTLRQENGAAVLRVRDNGVGIPGDVRSHLFKPFAQAPQTIDRSRGGLGLGLATVKGIVELHGGTVDVASAGAGCGSEFVVRLPLEGPPRVLHRGPRPAATSDAKEDVRRRRVLVIEDNADAAHTLKDVLELGGHEVRIAPDGPSGVAEARAFRPEVVLCDLGLPGMSGFEVARALRGGGTSTDEPLLIALSGYASAEDARRAMEAGFDRHIAKPASTEELEKLVASAPQHGG
jgi:two-component system CheB/CheR fusion protein